MSFFAYAIFIMEMNELNGVLLFPTRCDDDFSRVGPDE